MKSNVSTPRAKLSSNITLGSIYIVFGLLQSWSDASMGTGNVISTA